MDIRLTDSQLERRNAARQFAADNLADVANLIDIQQVTPNAVLAAMRSSGILGAALPQEFGGGEVDPVSYGLMTEEIGMVCSSMRSLMTVHNMSAQAMARFGTPEQRARWLPQLCSGKQVIAFALSEASVGSATNNIQTQAVRRGSDFCLHGTKKWITYGLTADLILVFAKCENETISFVVDRESEGLTVEPIHDILGTRGSMLAKLKFVNVHVDGDRQLGKTGMGLKLVANTALDHGRFSVAWGSTGIIQACINACLSYAENRRQGDNLLKDFQLVRRKLADMLVAHTASRSLCYRSACLRQQRDPRAGMETCLAKYHASAAAVRVATDAVHMHGANGCSAEYPVSRFLRDAMVAGITEGTNEIHQLLLSNYAFQRPHLE